MLREDWRRRCFYLAPLPGGQLLMDADGNLFGTTSAGGHLENCGGSRCGVIFKIAP